MAEQGCRLDTIASSSAGEFTAALRRAAAWAVLIGLFVPTAAGQAPEEIAAKAERSLRKAVAFFRGQVAVHGGYVWRYAADLSRREGEGKATNTMIWVQPPGTPTVGMAFMDAYDATRDRYYLEAAVESARALVRGQLQSGGWDYHIEFDPNQRQKYAYRCDGRTDGRNTTTLDDDTTQAALRLLIRVDSALESGDAPIHEAMQYGLDALLKAQYPNGAWPQRYSAFPDPRRFPVKQASYPETWSRTHPNSDYSGYYTLNDNILADTVETLLYAWETRREERYRAAAMKAGEFLLLAQMPDPQPAWAQQYDVDMHPAWARNFEPPAITGNESQGVIRTLLALYAKTQDGRYLKSAGRALEYLKNCRLPGGKLARFYELKTNRPLYFTRSYELTYRDSDVPTHYAFVVVSRLDALEAEYQAACEGRSEKHVSAIRGLRQSARAMNVMDVMDGMDARGAWVEQGRLRYHAADDPTREVIDTGTFVRNVRALSSVISLARSSDIAAARKTLPE